LGWKYVDAEEEGQKYKVGNFILECKRVIRGVDWEGGDPVVDQHGGSRQKEQKVGHVRKDSGVDFDDDEPRVGKGEEQDTLEFDSEDEDECEDLFMGIWTPALAKKRRRAKAWRDEREMV
jgi:hypothetical protein